LVDDHRLMRDGLRMILLHEASIDVVGEAGDGRTALRMASELRPDVVVMDVAMPEMNGIEATRQILSSCPGVEVIALSTHADKRYVLSMLDAGAAGYVIKNAAADELVRAVHAVARGDAYLSPEIANIVISRPRERVPSAYTLLSDREREVLQLLAEGRSSSEIAARLGISTRTVESHRANVMRKLGLHTVAALTKYAIREGLTSLER
jgi:DNA-binding NarL/FixJ family response regulator